jgi:unconventional prefoldin RPB5 interactor 1
VLEVLSKIENSDKNADETTVGQENGPDQVQVHDPRPREEHSVKQTSTSTRKGSSEATKGTKRGVSFAEGTKSAEDLSSRPKKESTHQKRPFYARPNSRFTGIFSSEEEDKSPPVIPANETPEDAALRKQIIDYSLSEVGSVVAELTLDEDSDLESDEDLDDEDLSAGSANEEDQWGRTTRRVVGDDYKKQMAELEQRLNAQMMVNAGPNGEHHDVEFQPQYSGSIVKKDGADGSKNQNLAQNGGMGFVKKPVKGKGVRWAGKPEIAPDSDPDGIRSTTLEDIVRETDLRESNISETSATKKQSRFKSSRLAAGPKPPNKDDTSQFRILAESQKPVSSTIIERAPVIQSNLSPGEGNGGVKMLVDDDSLSHEQEGPPTKTVLDEIVERPSSGLPTVPQTSDELDPDFLQQEVQTEYYRIRNRMIFKQGGFLEEDSEEMPIPEEEGGPPKMSKFKAARVKL